MSICATLLTSPARRITKFMTMVSVEILPEETSKKFSFNTRVSSASFGAKQVASP